VLEILEDQKAIIDLGGVRKEISIALVDKVQTGDYVILHVGFAIGKIDAEEAERTLQIFAELQASTNGATGSPV
jgi:hydrogenase expression/formation protein HypC